MTLGQFEHRRLTSSYLSRDKATTNQVLQLPGCYGQNGQKEKPWERYNIWLKTFSENRYYSSLCPLNLLLNCTMQIIFLTFQMRILHLFVKTTGHTIQVTAPVHTGIWKQKILEIFFLLYLLKNQYSWERGRFPLFVQFKRQST